MYQFCSWPWLWWGTGSRARGWCWGRTSQCWTEVRGYQEYLDFRCFRYMGMKSVELRNWRKIYSLQRFLAIPCSSFPLSAGGDLLANCYEAHDRNQATQPEVRVNSKVVRLTCHLTMRVTCRGQGGAGGVWVGGAPAATTAHRTPGWCPGRGRGWSGARGQSPHHQGSPGGSLNIANSNSNTGLI